MSTAAGHLAAARGLFDTMADFEPADDDDAGIVIAAFRRLADEVCAGLEAVEQDTPAAVVRHLEMLHDAVEKMAAAGVAAGVIAKAADRS